MPTVTKEKNLFAITTEEGKTYGFDTATGNIIGLRGKPISTCPAVARKAIHCNQNSFNAFTLMYYRHEWDGYEYTSFTSDWSVLCLDIGERLESIGYHLSNSDCGITSNKESYEDFLRYCQKNFKHLSKFIKEHKNSYTILHDFFEAVQREKILQENGLKIDEHFTEPMLNFIINHSQFINTSDRIKATAYFMVRGLWVFCENYSSYMARLLREYFNYCEELGWNVREKGGFVELYAKAKRSYLLHREEIDNAELEKSQMRFAEKLAFDFDDMRVIIPTTCKQFEEEANSQQNCVYSLYLPKCVNGNTNVVFIRKKDSLDESYITCEVNNQGCIEQYYLARNIIPRSEHDINFYHAFRDHLKAVWNR